MFPDPGPVRCSTAEAQLVRAVWIVGPALVIVLAGFIAREPGYSVVDVWFVVVVAAAIVARYVDVSRFKRTTLFGDPASMAHVRAYWLKLLITATGGWGIAHWAPSAL